MKRGIFQFISALMVVGMLSSSVFSAPSSKTFSALTKYMPTLSEVGFLTGIVNTYMQAATLIRVINAEIKMAKRTIQRFDELQEQSKNMWSNLQSLQDINIYDMDSWADWLDRAENLVTWQSESFMDILVDGIMTDFDTRLSKDFVDYLGRVRSYDIRDGHAYTVMSYYYHDIRYRKIQNESNLNGLKSVNAEIGLLQAEVLAITTDIEKIESMSLDKQQAKKDELESLRDRKTILMEQAKRLSQAKLKILHSGSMGKQADFMTQLSEEIFNEIPRFQDQLSQYNKELQGLFIEWESMVSGKVSKTYDRDMDLSGLSLEGLKDAHGNPKYEDKSGPKNSDIAQTPENDIKTPRKVNTSSTSTVVSLGDILKHRNRIEYQKLKIQQTTYAMELFMGNIKALLLANKAYQKIDAIANNTTVVHGAQVMNHELEKKIDEYK